MHRGTWGAESAPCSPPSRGLGSWAGSWVGGLGGLNERRPRHIPDCAIAAPVDLIKTDAHAATMCAHDFSGRRLDLPVLKVNQHLRAYGIECFYLLREFGCGLVVCSLKLG